MEVYLYSSCMLSWRGWGFYCACPCCTSICFDNDIISMDDIISSYYVKFLPQTMQAIFHAETWIKDYFKHSNQESNVGCSEILTNVASAQMFCTPKYRLLCCKTLHRSLKHTKQMYLLNCVFQKLSGTLSGWWIFKIIKLCPDFQRRLSCRLADRMDKCVLKAEVHKPFSPHLV
jgi:hypothetical protein